MQVSVQVREEVLDACEGVSAGFGVHEGHREVGGCEDGGPGHGEEGADDGMSSSRSVTSLRTRMNNIEKY